LTSRINSGTERRGWWAAVALFLLLASLVAIRAFLVDRKIGTYIACPGCFHLDVVLTDLITFAAVASLLLISSSAPTRLWVRLPLLLCGVLLLVYGADLVVFGLYTSRLLMTDVTLFLPEGGAVWDQFTTGLGKAGAVAVIVGSVMLFVFLWWMPTPRSRVFRLLVSLLLLVSLGTSAFFRPAPYVNDWAVENVFAANMSTPSRNRYSDESEAKIMAREVERITWNSTGWNSPGWNSTSEPAGRGRNVILLMLESWSVWHSELFGGFEGWTPRLDEAATRGRRFENFHSIGFSTDKGLAGILAGQQLWAPFLHWFETPPFHSMWGIEDGLPTAFNPHGYHTAFLTAGPLDLYKKGEWLSDLGFAVVEGREHPFYEGWPRFAFGSAPDRALYQRALDWMKSAPEPWLLVIETVSTHQPYRDPASGDRSLELAMRYADREFGTFLDTLEAQGFSDNGVLLVASDHRSMTPMSRRELDKWGAAAYSLVPAFIIASEFAPGTVDDAVYSQSDVAPSFEWWAGGEVALEPFKAVMIDPGFEADKCAFHERSDRRGVVEVICNEGRGQVLLDGDHTRFISGEGLSAERRRQALDIIARQRLEAWHRHLATTRD